MRTGSLIRLDKLKARDLTAVLPADTLTYLQEVGVPEHFVLLGPDYTFDLSFKPLLDGSVLQVVDADHGLFFLAIEKYTGRFGVVDPEPYRHVWDFVNTSLPQFMECLEGAERLWELER